MNLARDSLKIFFARVVTSFASFGAVIVFSRELGADPLGVYYPFVALLGILALPTDFGLSLAVEKRISEGEDRPQYFAGGGLIRLFLLIIFSFPIYLFQTQISTYIGTNVGSILIIALWSRVSADFSLGILKGELRVGETAAIRVLQPLIWLTIGYALISIGYGVDGIIYSHILGTIAVFVVASWRISIQPAIPEWTHIRSLFDFSKFSFINAIGGTIYSWMDVIILTVFVSLEIASSRGEIGAYENAWRVSLLVIFVSRSIGQVIFPQISQWNARNETSKIEQVLAKAIIPGLVIVLPAFVGALIFSEEILIHLFGNEFAVAAPALIILVGLRFFQAIDAIYGRMVDALDRPDLTMISTIVAIVINLLLNIILIYILGILGAAIATTSAVIVKTYIDVHYMRSFIEIKIPYRILGWSFFSSVIMGVALYLFSTNIPVDSLTELLVLISGGVGIYVFVLLVYNPVRGSLWELIKPLVSSTRQN
jgi:O-antigen/teichoic acid export membrane protein